MDLKILAGFLFYWGFIFLIFGGILSGDVLFDGYNTTGTYNSTFQEEELDLNGGGFFAVFDVFGVIIGAIGRFIALVFFGITPVLTGDLQVIFLLWQSSITMIFIAWIINSIWSGG